MVEKYKRWLLLILLLVFYSNLYSQIQGKIEYTISINTDNKKEIPRTDENEQAIKILKSARDIIAYLNFTEKESLFEVEKAMASDAEKGINLTRIFAGKDNVFYYNIVTNERLSQNDFMGELFLISKQPIEWEVKQESKQIGNYTCFKAIKRDTIANNKKIIAWFTPQIPISFEPKEFNGLPGLILEVNQSLINFKATRIEINPKKIETINKPTKGKRLTEEKFKQMTKETASNIFGEK